VTRHLAYRTADPVTPARLALVENDGTETASYDSVRSFRRIQRDGQWWRLAGQDRANGDMIYLREVELT
jgi:hypothetical protein